MVTDDIRQLGDLGHNSFEGPFSPKKINPSKLIHLSVSGNIFSGSIPDEIRTFISVGIFLRGHFHQIYSSFPN